jgi:hypothetical protein
MRSKKERYEKQKREIREAIEENMRSNKEM